MVRIFRRGSQPGAQLIDQSRRNPQSLVRLLGVPPTSAVWWGCLLCTYRVTGRHWQSTGSLAAASADGCDACVHDRATCATRKLTSPMRTAQWKDNPRSLEQKAEVERLAWPRWLAGRGTYKQRACATRTVGAHMPVTNPQRRCGVMISKGYWNRKGKTLPNKDPLASQRPPASKPVSMSSFGSVLQCNKVAGRGQHVQLGRPAVEKKKKKRRVSRVVVLETGRSPDQSQQGWAISSSTRLQQLAH